MNRKRKHQIFGLSIACFFVFFGVIKIIKREQFPLTDWILFDYFNSMGFFDYFPTPFLQIVVIIFAVPDAPFNIFFFFYRELCLLIEHGPSGLINPGGYYCHFSDSILSIFTFVTILVTGNCVGSLIYKIKNRKKL